MPVLKTSKKTSGSGFVLPHSLSYFCFMSRPLRIEFAGALYHVMARGNAREAIFLDDEDRHAFCAGLSRVCDRFRLSLVSCG